MRAHHICLMIPFLAIACGPNEPSPFPDIGSDTAQDPSLDFGLELGFDTSDTGGDTSIDPAAIICLPCDTSAQCGAPGALCLALPSGETVCGFDCSADPTVCPAETSCQVLDADNNVAQCVRNDLLCDDPCLTVECDEGEVCDPFLGGECVPVLGQCEPCDNNFQCGGEDDLCLRFNDEGNTTGCTTDCSSDPTVCGPDTFCGTVTTAGGEMFNQCVPNIGTCTDRCVDVSCTNNEICNPRTGVCEQPGGVCDGCGSDVDCGGEADQCVGLRGPSCETDANCPPDGFCVEEGYCVFPRCGVDCSVDPQGCPSGTACFNVGDGSQCLPLRLTCEPTCDDVVCDEGFNCDDVSGDCVASVIDICGGPCESSAACGGYDDLCVNTGTTSFCAQGCGEEVGPCPVGYICGELVADVNICFPNNDTFDCRACLDSDCVDGSVCNPVDGSCVDEPLACEDGDICPDGFLCSTQEGRCDPIGSPCTYETRLSVCDIATTACTASVAEALGTCEQRCITTEICPLERPECVGYHNVFGSACVDAGMGGADTCGRLMANVTPVGRPCIGTNPTDPILCSGETDFCVMGMDTAVPGFCSFACSGDAECEPHGATCEATPTGDYCVPSVCSCLLDPVLDSGQRDLVAELLGEFDATRCSTAWPLYVRRAVFGLNAVHGPATVPIANQTAGDPLQGPLVLVEEIAAVVADQTSAASTLSAFHLAAAAWDVTIDEPAAVPPVAAVSPLWSALQGFTTEFGAPLPGTYQAEVDAIPEELQIAVAELLIRMTASGAIFEDFANTLPSDNFRTLYGAFFAGSSEVDYSDESVVAELVREVDYAAMLQFSYDIANAIEAFPRDFATDLSGVSLFVPTSVGIIMIGSNLDDTYANDGNPIALLIELGGDDTYEHPGIGTTYGPQYPFSIAIDLGGADAYRYVDVPDPLDGNLLASDGMGRLEPSRTGDGQVTLSTTHRHGVGVGGFGALYDWGSGHDTFESLRGSQGFGMLGVGLLVDDGGTADITSESLSQGAGLFGLGVIATGNQEHTLYGMQSVMGFGGPHGIGVAIGGTANDTYIADPGSSADDTIVYINRLRGGEVNFSASMGAGVGSTGNGSTPAYDGGVGVFIEVGGNDNYTAGAGALGFGHMRGAGLFREMDGDDVYAATALSFGAGHTFGNGSFIDFVGSDEYGSEDARIGTGLGFGEDFAGGIFQDHSGGDTYYTAQYAHGIGVFNGFGAFTEVQGDDVYDADSNDSFGKAILTVFGSDPTDNPRRDVPTYGLFVDGNGSDQYDRPDLIGVGIGNDRDWQQFSTSEEGLLVYGGGLDADGVTFWR